MEEPTDEQLKILREDIISGRVMIVEVEHYKKMDDDLGKTYDRIKELEDYLLEFGGHKKGCLANIAKEHCTCGFDQARKGK